MIRPAKAADIPRLWALTEEMFLASIYVGHDEPDMKIAKGLFLQGIQRHGLMSAGGTRVMVTEKDGVVEGFLLGILDRVYHIGHKLTATDMYFYASPRASSRAAIELLDDFLAWAEGNSKVVEICLGATNAVGDYHRTGLLYRRKGLAQCGVMHGRLIFRRTQLDQSIEAYHASQGVSA